MSTSVPPVRRANAAAMLAAPPPQTPLRGAEAPTEKFRAPATVEPSRALPGVLGSAAATAPDVDRVWLRCTAALVCAMGVATLLTAVSTYLMAVETETIAWVLYGLAGVVTVGMGAVMWYFLRELANHTSRATD